MCTNLKTLIIQWSAPTIPPADGYTIKYRPIGTTTWNTFLLTNPMATNVAIPNVESCVDVEVSIQANCGGGAYGFESTTLVSAGCQCKQYELVNGTGASITYSYFSCDGIEMTANLAAGSTIYFSSNTQYGPIRTAGGTLTPGSCA